MGKQPGDKIAKPWGWERIADSNPPLYFKYLHIDAGRRTSKQMHHTKSEVMVLLYGKAHLITSMPLSGEKVTKMESNKLYFVPAGTIHRIEAKGTTNAVIAEIADSNDDDDIIRLDDDYGRHES